MQLRLTSILLIPLLGLLARDAAGFECRRRLLTADEQRTLEVVVLESQGLAVDPSTIVACRNWDNVVVNTVHAPQPDGNEKFAPLNCWLTRRSSRTPWQCVGQTYSGFRVDTYPGELGVWVGIATPTALGLARRLAARGIELLGHEGTLPYCGGGGEPRTLASLRTEMTRGSGFVLLGRQQDHFWLTVGEGVTINFERVPEDSARVECWYVEDIIVTS